MAEGNQRSGKRLVGPTLGFVVGVSFMLLFVKLSPNTSPPIALFLIFSMLAGAVAVHECGHLCAALLLDFRILAFSIGPLQITNENGKLHLRLSRDLRLGGMVSLAPKSAARLRTRMLRTVLAGPLTSFGAGVGALVIGMEAGNSGGWVLQWGVISIFLGVLASIPSSKFYVSDGARARMLFRQTPQADRCCAQLLLSAAAHSGVRPRDWDRALLDTALSIRDASGDAIVADIMAFEAAMDCKDFESAGTHLSAVLAGREKCPPSLNSGIALDAALYESAVRGDAVAGRHWLQECDPTIIVDRYYLLLVEAAVLLAEQKPGEARAKATECLAALPNARFPGFAKSAEDWARLFLSRAQTQLAATTTE